jgi:transcriptional regulator with XRE-family HTH domain
MSKRLSVVQLIFSNIINIYKCTTIWNFIDIHFLSLRYVEELINKEKKEIGGRIRKLRELLSLTQLQLGKAVKISKGTIASMESGKGFTGDYLLAVVHFFSMDLSEFTQYNQTLPDELELRTRIKKYHQKNKSTAYKILDEEPNLNAIIEFRLIKGDFLKTPRTVNEIVNYCNAEYNLKYNSSVVSQALINATNAGFLRRIKGRGRNYLYQVDKLKSKKI